MSPQDRRSVLTAEATNLEVHVEMCALRHETILEKLENIEKLHATRWTRFERAVWAIGSLLLTSLGYTAVEILPILRALTSS